jgi:hypothetical protein
MTISTSGIGPSGIDSSVGGALPGTTVMSPDSLLAYCQIQLGELDGQVTSEMNTQQLALAERTAVQNVETTLESFGDQGPQTGDQMHTCVVAFQNAINGLPAGDPVAAQLQTLGTQMVQQYGYQEVDTASPQAPLVGTLNAALQVSSTAGAMVASVPGQPASSVPALQLQTPPPTATYQLAHAPANDQWKGTTDAVGNLADNIKSNAEMQMLSLQDLVSQRQQVVELATGMMSKEDETLTDGAKAIGEQ